MNFDFQPKTYFNETAANALIAKLTYPESQWGEEICIFATSVDGVIYFEIVDFYGNEYSIKPSECRNPLPLQELILLIESMEVDKKGEMGAINDTLLGIPIAESTLYPQLKHYFDQKRTHFGFL
jgi:hypothetical protein